jgi:hypothetical protein
MSASFGELATIMVMGKAIIQLSLLAGAGILTVLTSIVVVKLLGWDEQ